eukprot:4626517-Amphidinium_carterae.3
MRAVWQDVESRLIQLETVLGQAKLAAETDSARLQNETSAMVEELAERLESRLQVLGSFIEEGQTGMIREAQAVCARLADDALAGPTLRISR